MKENNKQKADPSLSIEKLREWAEAESSVKKLMKKLEELYGKTNSACALTLSYNKEGEKEYEAISIINGNFENMINAMYSMCKQDDLMKDVFLTIVAKLASDEGLSPAQLYTMAIVRDEEGKEISNPDRNISDHFINTNNIIKS